MLHGLMVKCIWILSFELSVSESVRSIAARYELELFSLFDILYCVKPLATDKI